MEYEREYKGHRIIEKEGKYMWYDTIGNFVKSYDSLDDAKHKIDIWVECFGWLEGGINHDS